jgi:O-antigen/teichoic acid export membrane protein
VWIYVSVACAVAGTIVAARVLGLADYGVYATALVTVGFFQTLLDLTVEESLTKFGFRYVAGQDWGRLRRLFRQALILKLAGGFFATVLLIALAPFADEVFDAGDVDQAILAAALLPLVQASENVGATALLLHSRYDLRGVYQAGSAALRLLAIAIGVQFGVVEALLAIVVAQAISTLLI